MQWHWYSLKKPFFYPVKRGKKFSRQSGKMVSCDLLPPDCRGCFQNTIVRLLTAKETENRLRRLIGDGQGLNPQLLLHLQ